MPPELPSNEQIFTETSRLVPLRATLPEGEKMAEGMRCWYETMKAAFMTTLFPVPGKEAAFRVISMRIKITARIEMHQSPTAAAYNETQPNDIIDWWRPTVNGWNVAIHTH